METSIIYCEPYKEQMFREELAAAGFEILEIKPVNRFAALIISNGMANNLIKIIIPGRHEDTSPLLAPVLEKIACRLAELGIDSVYGDSEGEKKTKEAVKK